VPDRPTGYDTRDDDHTRSSMSESDPTGYGESPETTDGPVAPGGEQAPTEDADATLTTDDDAQHDDGVVRPGNLPD
jgi:hypothetical protein